MKIPFLSSKAEETVNHVVDVASEKVKKAVNTAKEDKLSTLNILLPIIGTAFLIFSGSKGSKDVRDRDIPSKTVINNYYYYDRKEDKKC